MLGARLKSRSRKKPKASRSKPSKGHSDPSDRLHSKSHPYRSRSKSRSRRSKSKSRHESKTKSRSRTKDHHQSKSRSKRSKSRSKQSKSRTKTKSTKRSASQESFKVSKKREPQSELLTPKPPTKDKPKEKKPKEKKPKEKKPNEKKPKETPKPSTKKPTDKKKPKEKKTRRLTPALILKGGIDPKALPITLGEVHGHHFVLGTKGASPKALKRRLIKGAGVQKVRMGLDQWKAGDLIIVPDSVRTLEETKGWLTIPLTTPVMRLSNYIHALGL